MRLSIHLAGSHMGSIQLEKGCATMAYLVFGHHAVNAVTTTLQHPHTCTDHQLQANAYDSRVTQEFLNIVAKGIDSHFEATRIVLRPLLH